MKIELKNTEFKSLYEWLINHTDISTPIIGEIIHNTLKSQYDKAFNKYKDEKQEFQIGDKVASKDYGDKEEGKIIHISRLANGKFRYKIEYKYISDIDDDGYKTYGKTAKYFTKKNIKKI